MVDQTLRGLWWLPAEPDERLSGTLTVTSGDARLDLIGHFGPASRREAAGTVAMSLELADQERILGVTTDGKPVTLIDSTATNYKTHLPGLQTAVYRARAVVVGHRFATDERIVFDAVEIRTPGLEQWVGLVPFPAEHSADDAGVAVRITVRRPETIEAVLPDGGRVLIKSEIHVSGTDAPVSDATLRHTAWFGMRFTQARELDGVTHAATQLCNFLSLAVGVPVPILAVDAYCQAVVDSRGRPKRLHLLYEPARTPPSPARMERREMLFTYPESKDQLGAILGAWLAHHDLLEPVFALYFGTINNEHLYTEQRFLAFAQALETYDRRVRPDARRRDPAQHRMMVQQIVDAVPEQHRQWCKDALAFSNEVPLAGRLEQILSRCLDVSSRIVGEEGVPAFIKAVRDTRNYFTHWDARLEAKAASGEGLYRLVLQLRTVVETVLLLELGFDEVRIERVLERARRFERINMHR